MKKTVTVLLFVVSLMLSVVFAYNIEGGITPKPMENLQGTATSVLGVMQWIGYIVAVGMLIWVGIKYVTSGAGEKAKAKETLIPIVIGAVLIAAAVTIATAIFSTVSTSKGGTSTKGSGISTKGSGTSSGSYIPVSIEP